MNCAIGLTGRGQIIIPTKVTCLLLEHATGLKENATERLTKSKGNNLIAITVLSRTAPAHDLIEDPQIMVADVEGGSPSSSGARSGTDIGGHASPNISVIRQLQKI